MALRGWTCMASTRTKHCNPLQVAPLQQSFVYTPNTVIPVPHTESATSFHRPLHLQCWLYACSVSNLRLHTVMHVAAYNRDNICTFMSCPAMLFGSGCILTVLCISRPPIHDVEVQYLQVEKRLGDTIKTKARRERS
jgi:hypothetical protein